MSCVLLIEQISLVDSKFKGQVGKRERERGGGGGTLSPTPYIRHLKGKYHANLMAF